MEDKTFKAAPLDVAGLFGNKDTGAMAEHVVKHLLKADDMGAIHGSQDFDHSRIYKHIATNETAHQHFVRTKGRKPASIHELANHFHEHRHSFMGHKKEATSEKKGAGY